VEELLGLGVPPEFVPPSYDCALRLAASMRRAPPPTPVPPCPSPVQYYPTTHPIGPVSPRALGPASLPLEPLPTAREARPGLQRRGV
jgi:hypothetical protein